MFPQSNIMLHQTPKVFSRDFRGKSHPRAERGRAQTIDGQKIMEDFDEMRVEEDHAARTEAGSGAASSPPERQGDGVRLVIKNPAHDYDDYACRVR